MVKKFEIWSSVTYLRLLTSLVIFSMLYKRFKLGSGLLVYNLISKSVISEIPCFSPSKVSIYLTRSLSLEYLTPFSIL